MNSGAWKYKGGKEKGGQGGSGRERREKKGQKGKLVHAMITVVNHKSHNLVAREKNQHNK